jgi:Tfp pilus assembly protein PilF
MSQQPPHDDRHAGSRLVEAALDAQQAGDLVRAEHLYRQALDTADGHGIAHNNLANLLRTSGRFADAADHYRHALATMPDSAEIRSNLATTLETLQRYDAAEADYRRARTAARLRRSSL